MTASSVGSNTSDGNGSYALTVPSNFAGTVTPSLSGYTFAPSSRTYSSLTADQVNQDYTGAPQVVNNTISGAIRTLSGQGIPSVNVAFSNGGPTVQTDGGGSYNATVPSGYTGTATPSLAGYTFNPANRSYIGLVANQATQDYTGTPPPSTYSILGTVSTAAGQAVAGVTVAFSNGGPTVITGSSGSYNSTVSSGYSGTATPSLSGYTFSPTSRPYASVTSNQTGQDYAATPPAATVAISGNIRTSTGQAVVGVTVSFSHGGPSVSTDGNGFYSATVSSGYSGTATPSLPGYTFSPANRPYSNVTADQTGQDYAGTPPASGSPVIKNVTNAASYAAGPISPGEVIAIFADPSNPIGAVNSLGLTLDQNGNVSTSLGGVQVIFLPQGILAPLIYVSATQVNAVVPYEVTSASGLQVQIKFLGQPSNSFGLEMAETAPAVFTLNGSGVGPGAVLNQDYSPNSSNNPAPSGSVIILYMTGEGQTDPAGVTGKVTTTNLPPAQLTPRPLAAVSAAIDGKAATVLYAGEAPDYVAGLMQVNVQVPYNSRSGSLPIQVNVGSNSSQNGVTVAVLGQQQALPTITSLTISPSTVASGANATVTINLSGAVPTGVASVTLSSSNNSAFLVSSPISIQAGQSSFSFQTQAGTVTSSTAVTVTATYNNSSQSATVTVTPPPVTLPTITSLTISPSTVASGTNATVTINLSGLVPTGVASVTLSSSNNSAFLVSSPISIQAGQSSFSFQTQAGTVTSSTAVTVTATYNNSSQSATVTVTPPPVTLPTITSLTISPSTVASGTNATVTINLSGLVPTGVASVTLSSSN